MRKASWSSAKEERMRSLSNAVHRHSGLSWKEADYPDLMTFTEEEPEEAVEPEETEDLLDAARLESERIFQENIQKAEEILAKAKEEAARIRKEAYEEGYVDGMQKGCTDGEEKAYKEHKEEMAEEYRQLQLRVEEYVQEMQHAKERVMEEYLDDLKDIALAIGEKIIQTSLKSSGGVVKNMILAAISKLQKTAWAKIYIAENEGAGAMDIQGDQELVRELSKISDNVKIIVMEDASPGSCIIERPQEVMDISVSTQMENIKEILNNARV